MAIQMVQLRGPGFPEGGGGIHNRVIRGTRRK